MERRVGQRVRVSMGVMCDRGRVVDLSSRGMRLRTMQRWPEGTRRSIRLTIGGEHAMVEAVCVWCRQRGAMTHDVGLAFQHVDGASARTLARLVLRAAGDGGLAQAA